MSVNGISNYPVLPLPASRSGGQERTVIDSRRSGEDTDNKTSPAFSSSSRNRAGELTDVPAQQRVQSAGRSKEVFSRRQAEPEELSFGARKALDAFAANTPSPEQQLGIELAGIDVFV